MNAETSLVYNCVLKAFLLGTILSTFSSGATTLTWDSATGDGVITEGQGTWNAGNSTFTTDNGVSNTSYSGGSDVIFGGGGAGGSQFTVNLGGTTFAQRLNASVSTLTFNSGARYTLVDLSPGQNSTISVADNGSITANVDATMSVSINGSSSVGSFTISGPGNLTMSGTIGVFANTLTVGTGHLILQQGGQDSLFANELKITDAAGVVTLQGADEQIKNTATVNLSAGTLNINIPSSKTENIGNLIMSGGTINGGKLSVPSGGSFDLRAGTINANLVNSGPLTKSTAGTVTLGNDNVGYTGGINVNAGTLQIGSGGSSGKPGSGTVTIASGATLAFNRSDSSLSMANAITGAGKVENKGSGTVTLSSANNDYTGGTTLTAGILKLGSPGALPAGGAVRFNGGTLALNNQDVTSSRTLGALSLQSTSSIFLDALNATHGKISFSGATWTGGALSVLGWAGSIEHAGTDDRIFITSAPGAGFLSHVQFYGVDGTTPIGNGADILPGGEMVPAVPEPVNISLAIFGGAFVGIHLARRRASSW